MYDVLTNPFMKPGLTNDLSKSEEIVLVKIALNPELNGGELRDKLETSTDSFSDCLDTLIERKYVEMLEQGSSLNWRVTDLGRLALEKFANVLRYDILYAKKRGDIEDEILVRLRKRKLMFERALKACEGRMTEEEEVEEFGGFYRP